jgi:hypothetical protein
MGPIPAGTALGIDRASVTRYLSGQVPGPVAAAMTCWLAHYRRTGEKPQALQTGRDS